jgi:ADP-L-glycero-D-manno-heptose 6-epimerase
MYWLMHHRKNSGIYNIGTGEARSFNSLATVIFKSLGLESKVEYVDTPEDIREKYQYFTEADIKKIKSIGYPMDFTTLEAGVDDYIKNYLLNMTYY